MKSPTRSPRDQAALALGLVGLISPLFALSTSSNNNFVLVEDLALLVFPALGLIAVAGALTARRTLILVSGVGFALAALLQLIQFGRATNWLGGNGSTFSLFMALAVGLMIACTVAPTRPPT
ncbi:MAG: hypothetical protein M3445_03620 [Actinomycetota bacterium]|nr:hypothetical protein [Actinomycetota bacterium]